MLCPSDIEMFQPSGHVTIDKSSNSFLDAATNRCRRVLPDGAVELHGDRDTAVAHCLSKTGDVNIIGHGDVGIIGTGCGATSGNASTLMTIDALGNWTDQHKMKSLTLIACHTGGDDKGADFLFALAKAIGVPVRAPAGFVFIGAGCEDFYLDPTHKFWQSATKAERPKMIPAGPHRPMFDPLMLRLAVKSEFIAVAKSDVPWARYVSSRRGAETLGVTWEGPAKTADPIRFVDFDRPMLRGLPAAFVTGTFELSFLVDGKELTRTFLVYNDRLIQDKAVEHVFYRADIPALLQG